MNRSRPSQGAPRADGLSSPAEPQERLGPTGFDPSRMAATLSPQQRAIVSGAAKANDFRQAWYLWRLAELPGYAGGNEVVRLIKPTGLFENRMGGAQLLVWKLNERGRAVAAAIAMEARQGGDDFGSVRSTTARPSPNPDGPSEDTPNG